MLVPKLIVCVDLLIYSICIVLTDAPPAAKRCKMEPSPQSSSPSVKSHDAQSTSVSSQQSAPYLNNVASVSGSGVQMNLQASAGPPPNVVIPPQHNSNPPSVGSTASQSATPIQPHPPAAAMHALPNQLVQQTFSPQANSMPSTASASTPQHQAYAPSFSSTIQQGGMTATSYTQEMHQHSSQPHPNPNMDGAGSSSLSATASNPIGFDSGVSIYNHNNQLTCVYLVYF